MVSDFDLEDKYRYIWGSYLVNLVCWFFFYINFFFIILCEG